MRPLPADTPLPRHDACACGGTCPRCRAADPAGHAPADSRSPARDTTGTGGGSGSGGGSTSGSCGATKTVAIDFVKLRGASRNPTADLAFANTVFAPACVQFTSAGVHTTTNAQSDGWIGDTDLASGVCPITGEETAAYSGSISAFSLSSRLKAFYVTSISTSDRGNSHPPYCAGASISLDTINVTNSGASRTLAHEIGHVLLNSGDHPADTGNLMHATNTATGETLTAAQRATIFANA